MEKVLKKVGKDKITPLIVETLIDAESAYIVFQNSHLDLAASLKKPEEFLRMNIESIKEKEEAWRLQEQQINN